VKVQVTPTARRQIVALAAWWSQHRAASRVRVEDALEAAVDAMGEHPGLGPTYSQNPR
jgi:plasmid stabilization system protein ParE